MAGEDAVSEPQIVDSRGFGTPQFGERQHAKCGRLSVHGFAKAHPIHTPQGKACAAVATPGHANCSPYLRKITDMMPEGSGGVPGDAAYRSAKNCNAIRDGARRAVMVVESNATPELFSARAGMPRFRE